GEQPLLGIAVKGREGIAKVRESGGVRDAPIPVVRLGELGRFERRPAEKAIYHKDLRPVAYVYAEPVGRAPPTWSPTSRPICRQRSLRPAPPRPARWRSAAISKSAPAFRGGSPKGPPSPGSARASSTS